jgi:hypothetical protein
LSERRFLQEESDGDLGDSSVDYMLASSLQDFYSNLRDEPELMLSIDRENGMSVASSIIVPEINVSTSAILGNLTIRDTALLCGTSTFHLLKLLLRSRL